MEIDVEENRERGGCDREWHTDDWCNKEDAEDQVKD